MLALNVTALTLLIATNLRNGLASPWWLNAILLAAVGVALVQTRPARATA